MRFLPIFVALILGMPGLTGAAKPNFIIILVDDMGYNSIWDRGLGDIKTPHIDKLSEAGMMLTEFYATSPICTPTRASLMTGRYPSRTGLGTPLHPDDKEGLASDEVTIAEILKRAGYATACIGKWHLGHQSEHYPTRHGFDYYYGTPLGHCFAPEAKRKTGKNSDLFLRNDEKIAFPRFADLTSNLTDEAIRWIGANKEKPFFLFLSHPMPHVPLAASERFRGRSEAGLYGDVCEEIDWSVGQIVATLKENDIEENTFVVFTSDNGAEDPGHNAPFRGKKQQPLEGGIRVPCIIKWPDRVYAATYTDELMTVMDFFPTFAALAGVELPADRIIDGRDATELILGEKGAKSSYDYFVYHARFGNRAGVRMGKWKLLIDCEAKTWKHKGLALYDLKNDIREEKNLVKLHPEVVEDLMKRLTEYEKSLGEEEGVK